MHPYDEFVTSHILSQCDVREAREWLSAAGSDYGVVHEMLHDETMDAVEEAYRRGAAKVEVIGVLPDDAAECSADMLLITLPAELQFRAQLFELEELISGGERGDLLLSCRR